MCPSADQICDTLRLQIDRLWNWKKNPTVYLQTAHSLIRICITHTPTWYTLHKLKLSSRQLISSNDVNAITRAVTEVYSHRMTIHSAYIFNLRKEPVFRWSRKQLQRDRAQPGIHMWTRIARAWLANNQRPFIAGKWLAFARIPFGSAIDMSRRAFSKYNTDCNGTWMGPIVPRTGR